MLRYSAIFLLASAVGYATSLQHIDDSARQRDLASERPRTSAQDNSLLRRTAAPGHCFDCFRSSGMGEEGSNPEAQRQRAQRRRRPDFIHNPVAHYHASVGSYRRSSTATKDSLPTTDHVGSSHHAEQGSSTEMERSAPTRTESAWSNQRAARIPTNSEWRARAHLTSPAIKLERLRFIAHLRDLPFDAQKHFMRLKNNREYLRGILDTVTFSDSARTKFHWSQKALARMEPPDDRHMYGPLLGTPQAHASYARWQRQQDFLGRHRLALLEAQEWHQRWREEHPTRIIGVVSRPSSARSRNDRSLNQLTTLEVLRQVRGRP